MIMLRNAQLDLDLAGLPPPLSIVHFTINKHNGDCVVLLSDGNLLLLSTKRIEKEIEHATLENTATAIVKGSTSLFTPHSLFSL